MDNLNNNPNALGKTMNTRALFAIGLGCVIGWSWIIYGGPWSSMGGSLGGVVAFAITGLLCSFIGLVYAELTSAYPQAGGDVVFSFEGLGTGASVATMWCMLTFWISLIMVETMMFPVIAVRLGVPIPQAIPLYNLGGETVYASYLIISIAVNAFFAFINSRGAELSGKLQTAAVYLLLAAALFFFFSAIFKGSPENMKPVYTDRKSFLTLFLMLPAFMSGFNSIPQAAEEVDAPPRIIGRMVIFTVWGAVLFYLLVVLGTALALPAAERAKDGLVVLDAVSHLYNNSKVVNLGIAFASFLGMLTTWNACYIAASRLIVGLGRAKYLPKKISEISNKTHTPVKAIMVTCIITSFGAFLGTSQPIYVAIANIMSLQLVFNWLLISIAYYRLNKLRPDLDRPYRVKYPKLVGILAIVFSFFFLSLYTPLGTAALSKYEWLVVALEVVIGFSIYFGWQKRAGYVSVEERRKLLGLK